MSETKTKAFENSFNPKCIYIFRIHDPAHQNLLKIGDATVKTDKPFDQLYPNCSELNKAARLRIKDYTNTAGITYDLLHTELAVMETKDEEGTPVLLSFKDHKVHDVLKNSNIERVEFADSTAREWFKVDLETAKKAITAVKKGKKNLSGEQITQNFSEILFRPEQNDAIKMTLDKFKTQNRMLWNAKMRFGKTLTALEVVRKLKFDKTIIITHRPVVDAGWYDDFNKIFYEEKGAYIYGSKSTGTSLKDLLDSGKKFVYFASMQDLRGSKRVGGNFDKNDDVFDLDWDLVIVDEAHEGTTTMLGDSVIKEVVKEDGGHVTKFLALSGTPFNILNDFENNIYTWDYIMEQKAKADWGLTHLEPNPYDDLPKMNIFTYDIGQLLYDGRYVELEDKAFNFREFFRVWTGDVKRDGMPLPEGISEGDFYHEEDVAKFLDLICQASEESQYPYANEEYRNIFKHTLWMVPGVKEAKALSKMLKNHSTFSFFDIVNVAGDGDEEEAHDEALKKVRNAIKKAGSSGYTITLSCGKLTTGVTVPEWTAAFYLAGSFSTSASSYLQTIFRVQSPCNKYGMMKNVCYVFDFAPDRTLKMVAEAAAISTKAGGTSSDDRKIMGEFLNYCPVISINGTMMKPYDTANLLQQLKRAYAERAVRTGFDDINIYSNELLKLTDNDLSLLKDIKGIIGTSKAAHQTNEIDINLQGFTEEEYEQIEKAKKKKKKELSEEEKRILAELKKKRQQKKDAISVLRGISIRMPLLIYGADIPFEDDVDIENLPNLVDDSSWEEFMPNGITKEKFKELTKFYDQDIFVAAGRRIRNVVKSADTLPPIERVQKIAELFSCFKNPDKETVLTPWRVVNMHMGECLGGWNFFDEQYEKTIEEPRFIDNGKVTQDTLGNAEAKVLEINSKTGLYPLYVTASIFIEKCKEYGAEEIPIDVQETLWKETVENNVFVVCKTPMAKQITRRTLVGFSNTKVNAHYFEDLINQFREKPEKIVAKILKPPYWGQKGAIMKFNAVVGNPPYMEIDNGAFASAKSIYQYFVEQGKNLSPDFFSMIIPSRWFAGGKGLDSFRDGMLNDDQLRIIHDFPIGSDCFPNTRIAGGVNFFLWEKGYHGDCEVYSHNKGEETSYMTRPLLENNAETFIRFNEAVPILRKVQAFEEESFSKIVSARKPYGLPSNYFSSASKLGFPEPDKVKGSNEITIIGTYKYKTEKRYVPKDYPFPSGEDTIGKYKVFVSQVLDAGFDWTKERLTPFIGKPNEVCTETFLRVGAFDDLETAENVASYINTKLFHLLMHLKKVSHHVTQKVYEFVPMQDFSRPWSDKDLYEKYGLSEDEINYIESKIRAMD